MKNASADILTSTRDSNMELLRIVSMLFILIHHFLVHGVFPQILDFNTPLDSGSIVATILNGFCYVGVNCFVLISGYFGIKFKWKSLLNIYLCCVTYALLGYLYHIIATGSSIGMGLIYNTLMVFSHGHWWYISCYLILFCLAPVLNEGIRVLTFKQYSLVIGVLTICQVYFGNIWHADMFDADGYSVLHFVYLYLIGGFIHRFSEHKLFQLNRYVYFSLYVVMALMWGVLTCLKHKMSIPGWTDPFSYNSLICVLMSLGLFLFFTTIQIKSESVNWMASGVLAAYLIQDQYNTKSLVYDGIVSLTEGQSVPTQLMIVVTAACILLVVAIVLENVRKRLFNPILNKLLGND